MVGDIFDDGDADYLNSKDLGDLGILLAQGILFLFNPTQQLLHFLLKGFSQPHQICLFSHVSSFFPRVLYLFLHVLSLFSHVDHLFIDVVDGIFVVQPSSLLN